MAYVDGYLIPVPKNKVAAYRALARKAGKVWREHGALEYRECVGEELDGPCGIPFSKQLKLKRGETVIFAWIVFKNKTHRNRVNDAAMNDPRLANMDPKSLPFDSKRMSWGGFKVLVEA